MNIGPQFSELKTIGVYRIFKSITDVTDTSIVQSRFNARIDFMALYKFGVRFTKRKYFLKFTCVLICIYKL